MVDMLDLHLARARARPTLASVGVSEKRYALVTLHRPSNVDDPAMLARLLALLGEVASRMPVIFPVHPRTRARLEAAEGDGLVLPRGLTLLPPQGYLDFLALLDGAKLVLTDSGGVQEETTALGVPCLTLRENAGGRSPAPWDRTCWWATIHSWCAVSSSA